MAACIVCNQQIKPDDFEDVGDMASLRSRLEQVLDEAVPQDSVICLSCQSDLAEIEMYYALLTVFKKRYSETVKQRSQLKGSQNDKTRRNLLHETAGKSSQDIFGAGNVLQHSDTHMKDSELSEAVLELDILGVGVVKKEWPMNENISAKMIPSEHTGIEQGQSSNIGQAETIENSSDECETTTWECHLDESEINTQELQESKDLKWFVSPNCTAGKDARKERKHDTVVSLRKRGRPKMTKESRASTIPCVSDSGMKKHGRKTTAPHATHSKLQEPQIKQRRPKRDKPSDLVPTDGITIYSKKHAQQSKNEQSASFNIGQRRSRAITKHRSVYNEESESGESTLAEQNSEGSDDSLYDESDLEPLKLMKNRSKRKDRSVYYKESESGESSLTQQNSNESHTNSSYDESDLEPLRRPSSSPGKTESVKEEVGKGEAAHLSLPNLEPMTSQNTIVHRAPLVKKKQGKPKEDEDPSYDPDAVVPVRRKKAGRPKKIDDGPFPCTVCDKVLCSQQRLKVHMRSHSEVRPHVCSVCGKAFKTSSALKVHTNTHNGTKQFVCETCGRGFTAKADLEKHLFLHSDEFLYPCEQCDKRFKSPVYLKAHVKLHHVEGRKFLCSICGAASFTKQSLKMHMTTHSEAVKEKLWKCNICGNHFATRNTCQIHEKTHNPGSREKHLCPICGKSLLSKQYLKLHMKQHTGDTDISCSVCNATFTAPAHYRRHMSLHSGEKPYKCTICQKGFRLASTLKQHMTSHTDERPFRCSCGLTYRQKSKLKKHMCKKGHTGFEAKSVNSQSLNVEVPATAMSVTQPVATASQYGLLPYGSFLPNENVL